jgi:hypothetical protein
VIVDFPDVWGMFLSRKFVATLGGALQLDLTRLDIPIDDGIYARLPNMSMSKNHDEEIDIDSDMEEPLEVEESLLDFFPDDFPFAIEEDFSVIEWPKKEDYQQQLDKYEDKEIGFVKILKKEDKDLLIRSSQGDVLTSKSHPLSSRQYTRVIQETIDVKGGEYKRGDLVLEWNIREGQPNT